MKYTRQAKQVLDMARALALGYRKGILARKHILLALLLGKPTLRERRFKPGWRYRYEN